MFDKNRGPTGFPLMGIIVALGMISIIGILILQMFMASARLNTHARNIDTASFIAMSTLEKLRSGDDPNRLLDTEFIEGSQVAFGHSAFFVIDERMAFSMFDFSSGFRLYKYYDINWRPVNLESAEEDPCTPQNIDAAFKLVLYLIPQEEAQGIDAIHIEGLFEVTLYIWNLSHINGQSEPFVDFYTKMYFPVVGDLI